MQFSYLHCPWGEALRQPPLHDTGVTQPHPIQPYQVSIQYPSIPIDNAVAVAQSLAARHYPCNHTISYWPWPRVAKVLTENHLAFPRQWWPAECRIITQLARSSCSTTSPTLSSCGYRKRSSRFSRSSQNLPASTRCPWLFLTQKMAIISSTLPWQVTMDPNQGRWASSSTTSVSHFAWLASLPCLSVHIYRSDSNLLPLFSSNKSI